MTRSGISKWKVSFCIRCSIVIRASVLRTLDGAVLTGVAIPSERLELMPCLYRPQTPTAEQFTEKFPVLEHIQPLGRRLLIHFMRRL